MINKITSYIELKIYQIKDNLTKKIVKKVNKQNTKINNTSAVYWCTPSTQRVKCTCPALLELAHSRQ